MVHIINPEEPQFVIGKKQKVKGEDKKGKEKAARGKKWSPEATRFLIDQVDKKRHIIESKATNRGFKELNLKNNAWHEISMAYNNKIDFTPRTVQSLKAKWDNLKSECKRRSDDLQKHLKKTGAAPDSSLTLTPQEERILGIMNVVKSSLENPFDDDSGCDSITYRSAPAMQEIEDDDSADIRADSRADQEEDIGSEGGDDDVEIVIEYAAEKSKSERSRSTSSLPTPTPVKRRKVENAKLTREDLDRAQMEIWELQKQQMVEKH